MTETLVTVIVVVVITLAILVGIKIGEQKVRDEQAEHERQAEDDRKEIDRDVNQMDDPTIDDELDKWMRDRDRTTKDDR